MTGIGIKMGEGAEMDAFSGNNSSFASEDESEMGGLMGLIGEEGGGDSWTGGGGLFGGLNDNDDDSDDL